MRASVTICRDPIRPAHNRTTKVVRKRHSISGLVPETKRPVICNFNGEWLSRAKWDTKVSDGDSVVFVVLPHGGGGGGSNPLRIILMIAVMVFAPQVAGAIMPESLAGELAFGSTTWFEVFKAGVGFLGGQLVNALVPPPKPSAASMASSSGGLASPSPTYSLGAQGNSARIGQPIPVIYGRHLVYPDFGAMPYVEYSGNEQYLYQLFCIGQGEYDIESIRIEDTAITSFPEITYEVVPPGGSVTLFPTSVVSSTEVSGQEALNTATLGPFVASGSGTVANYIGIDIVAPRGLYYANDAGGLNTKTVAWTVSRRLISDAGVAIGPWVVMGSETMNGATITPQRESYKYMVPPGRYEVKLLRTDEKDTNSRSGHELSWAGLRSYLPGTQNYGNVTMVAMKLRASNSLSGQASRKINFIVTRKLKTWNPTTGWSSVATPSRSIAWAIADICRATYGAAMVDSRINLQGLYELDQVWTARSNYLDGVFDTQSTIMEALTQSSRAGRGIPFVQGGIVHVVRDAPATIPVAMFSQRNITKNSLKLDYIMPTEDTADAIEVTYFDSGTWTERTVMCVLPGATSDKPAKVKLFGVTSRQAAWEEGMYIAACNRYRRRMLSFSTEMDGLIPIVGDLVAVQHDMPKWGQSGEIVAWDTGTKTATLSEPLDWSAGGQHKIGLRRRDGAVAGPFTATAGVDDYHVVLSTWVSGTDPVPDTGGDRERTHFAFGPSNSQYVRCRVLSMRPKSTETAEISLVVESDYVHLADTGTIPTDIPTWNLPNVPTKPAISGGINVVTDGSVANPNVSMAWSPAAGADYYLVETSSDGVLWTRIGEPSTSTFGFVATAGDVHLRVAPVGVTQGDWIQWTGTLTGAANASNAPTAPTGLTSDVFQTTIHLSWPVVQQSGVDLYEVWRSTSASTTSAVRIDTVPYDQAYFSDTVGISNATRYYWLKAVNVLGVVSEFSTITGQTTEEVGGINGLEIVTSLPTTANFLGRVVFLTTDKKIYRYDGTAWLTSVDGLDLIDGTVYASKIVTGTITAAQIAANAITSEKINADAITASKISAGAITGDKIAGTTITGDKIAAGAITAAGGHIANLAVDTLQIMGGAVTSPVFATGTSGTISVTLVLPVSTYIAFVWGGAANTNPTTFTLKINETTHDSVYIYSNLSAVAYHACRGYGITLAAGTHTISVVSSGSGSISMFLSGAAAKR